MISLLYSNISLISHINPLMLQFNEIRFRISGFLIPRTSNTNFRSRGILKPESGLGDVAHTVGNSQAPKKKVLDGGSPRLGSATIGRRYMDRSTVRSGPDLSDPIQSVLLLQEPAEPADSADRLRALLSHSLVVNKNSTATLSDFPARLSHLLPIGCCIFFRLFFSSSELTPST